MSYIMMSLLSFDDVLKFPLMIYDCQEQKETLAQMARDFCLSCPIVFPVLSLCWTIFQFLINITRLEKVCQVTWMPYIADVYKILKTGNYLLMRLPPQSTPLPISWGKKLTKCNIVLQSKKIPATSQSAKQF